MIKPFIIILFLLSILSCKFGVSENDTDYFEIYLEDLKKYPKGIYRENQEHLKNKTAQDLVLEIENNIRRIIPRAGNQIKDMLADSLAYSKAMLARDVNIEYLDGHPGFYGIDNILKTASASQYFRGGLCNEYSALSFTDLMLRDLDEPINRCWSRDYTHSFTYFGDYRDPKSSSYIVDPWVNEREVVSFSDSRFRDADFKIVETWKDRKKGEGRLIINEHNSKMDSVFYTENKGLRYLETPHDLKLLKSSWKKHLKNGINSVNNFHKTNILPGNVYDTDSNKIKL